MSRIYEMSDGRKAVLYGEGSRILFYTFPVRRGNLPTVVREDYLQDLTTIEFRGNLFFAYKNLEKQIILDSLGTTGEMILLAETGVSGEISNIKLGQAGGNLCLYYVREPIAGVKRQEEEEDTTIKAGYVLEVIFPYRGREKHRVSDGLARPSYDVYALEGQTALTFQGGAGTVENYVWRDGNFQREPGKEELSRMQEEEISRVREACARELKEMKEEHRQELESVKEEYQQKLESAEEAHQQELESVREGYQQELESMKEEYQQELRRLEEEHIREIDAHEECLQKAARQYEELAAVARNMQEALHKLVTV